MAALSDRVGGDWLLVGGALVAAEFFVNRIPDWREHVEPFRSGAAGRVLRPSPTLFLLLKLARLSDTDLADCVALLDRVRAEGLALDTARVLAALRVLPRSEDAALVARRAALERGLTEQT